MRSLALFLLAVATVSCAGKRPVTLAATPKKPSIASDTARMVLPGATSIGFMVKEGRLVLLGGRRALVLADGSVRHETTPTPEPLEGLLQVPTAKGLRLIGYSKRAVYRFDEPLGAPTILAHANDEYGVTGVGPGVVQLYAADMDAVFIDVETGKAVPWKGAPEMAQKTLAFVSMQNGLASVHDAPMVTTDGGATFKPLNAPPDAKGKPRRLGSPGWREGHLRFQVYASDYSGKDEVGEVDFATGTVRIVPPVEHKEAAPLLRYLRKLRSDPLDLAAANGLHFDPQHALIAAGGLWANVDLRNGEVVEVAPISTDPSSKGDEGCQFIRAGKVPWASCRLGPNKAGIFRLSLQGKLTPQKESVTMPEIVDLRASASGGLLYVGPCAGEKVEDVLYRKTDPYACVLQPDGQWKTFYQPHDPEGRELYPQAGPLKDGRIAALVIAPVVDPNPNAVATEAHFVVVNAQGEAQELPTFPLEKVDGPLTIDNHVQEDAQGVLRVVVSDDSGVFVFEQKPGGVGVARLVEGARWANIDGEHGVAIGEDLFVSNDAGATFIPLHVAKDYLSDVKYFEVWERSYRAVKMPMSEIGFSLDNVFRIGWKPTPQSAPSIKLEGGVFINVPEEPPAPPVPED